MFCLHVGSRGLPSSETRTYHDEHDVHFPSMEQDHGFSHDDVGVLADEIRRRLLAIGVDQADIDNGDVPWCNALTRGDAGQMPQARQIHRSEGTTRRGGGAGRLRYLR